MLKALRAARIIITITVLAMVMALPAIGQAGGKTIHLGDGCVKFDEIANELGPRVATVDGVTITLFNWRIKDGEASEVIGFDWEATGGIVTDIWVKSSQDDFHSTPGTASGSWDQPTSADGKLHAISHITMCVDDEPTMPVTAAIMGRAFSLETDVVQQFTATFTLKGEGVAAEQDDGSDVNLEAFATFGDLAPGTYSLSVVSSGFVAMPMDCSDGSNPNAINLNGKDVSCSFQLAL